MGCALRIGQALVLRCERFSRTPAAAPWACAVKDARVREFVLSASAIRYFEDLAIFIRQQSFTLAKLVKNAARSGTLLSSAPSSAPWPKSHYVPSCVGWIPRAWDGIVEQCLSSFYILLTLCFAVCMPC